MYRAIERKGGNLIHADSATKGRAYRCPNPHCNAQVFLRSGRKRVDHFAHMPGQGKPECEEFHFTDDLSRVRPQPQPAHNPTYIDHLSLSIELESTQHRQARWRWRLWLTVPKAPDARGEMSIDVSNRDTRRISLSKLSLGPENYVASPNMSEFGASWVSHDVFPEYRDAVTSRIAGLDPHIANAFSFAQSKLKPRVFALSWGECYYLVWKAERAISLPSSLSATAFERSDGWDCALVSLPREFDSEIESWVEERCGLTIAIPSREWALLYPAPFDLGEDGDLRVPPDDPIIVALKSSGPNAPGSVMCTSRGTVSNIDLSTTRRHHVIAMIDGKSGRENNVLLSWSGTYVATFAKTSYATELTDNCVLAVFSGADGRSETAFHSQASRVAFDNVRRKRLSLIALHGHPLLRGTCRMRRTGTSEWLDIALDFSASRSHPGAISHDALTQINNALQQPTCDFELRFGPFGAYAALGSVPIETVRPNDVAIALPARLRARIEWLSRASGAYADQAKASIATLSNAALLDHFRKLQVPDSLLAHQRSIRAELRQTVTGQP